MKALIWKELRENLKVAAIGLLLFTVLTVGTTRSYSSLLRDIILGNRHAQDDWSRMQPLTSTPFLTETAWLCVLFGVLLGWMQIFNERNRDLRAFLIHRPTSPTRIFLAKAAAGLALYSLAAGLPLFGFVLWAWLPGHVAAPFEWGMVRPVFTLFLAGLAFYFAGMLVGLRQARWYGSRTFGLALAAGIAFAAATAPPSSFWAVLAAAIVGGTVLATAAWGSFKSGGTYRGQPVSGKLALTITLLFGVFGVGALAVGLMQSLFFNSHPQYSWSRYVMTKDGVIYRLTQGNNQQQEIFTMDGQPAVDARTGKPLDRAEFNRQQAPGSAVTVNFDRTRQQNQTPYRFNSDFFSPFGMLKDTLWFFRYRTGRVLAYDLRTRRLTGSLGPDGFAPDAAGDGSRFSDLPNYYYDQSIVRRNLKTETAVYELDLDKPAARKIFTAPAGEKVGGAGEIVRNYQNRGEDYVLAVTDRSIHVLTLEGRDLLTAPYEPAYPDYPSVQVSVLEPPGQFALWFRSSNEADQKAGHQLPTRIKWLAADGTVSKTADLPELPTPAAGPERLTDKLYALVAPPVIVTTAWVLAAIDHKSMPAKKLDLKPLLTIEALLCSIGALAAVAGGWWLGRRYSFTRRAQLGWAAFHLLFGLPAFAAFLCAQEWPAREACANCKKLRVVDREKCEHCGADFAPPAKNGTEIFEPLGSS
jgi:hypothetical protein